MEKRPKIIRINLMRRGEGSPKKPSKEKRVARPKVETKPSTLIAIGCMVLAVLISLVWDYLLLKKEKTLIAQMESRKREVAKLESRVKHLKRIEKEIKALKEKKRIIAKIIAESHQPLKVMLAVQNSMPDEVWLSKLNLGSKKLDMSGYSVNDEALATFVERLQKNPLVASVSISRYEKTKVNDVEVRRFVGGVRIK